MRRCRPLQTNVAAQYPDIVQRLAQYAREAHVDNPMFPIQNCRSSEATDLL